MNQRHTPPVGMTVLGMVTPRYAEILTPQALAFVGRLQRRFGARRRELLAAREERQRALGGQMSSMANLIASLAALVKEPVER